MTLSRTVFAMATALTLAASAASVSAANLRFTVWTGNQAHLKMLNGIAADFKAGHPDVSINFETMPAGDYTQKLTFQLAGGNPPDLGWMMEDAAPAFADAGVLTDIGPALRADKAFDLDDFSRPAMKLWVDADKVFGVPFSTSPFMIFFNKDMFDKAGLDDPLTLASRGGWDMAAFRKAARALTGERVWGFEFKDGQGYGSRIMHAIMPPIRAFGGDAWQGKSCGFEKPEAVAALKVLHEMVFQDRSIVPPGQQGDFFTKSAAMTINQISRASKMPEAGFKWGIAPLPSGPAGSAPVIGQAGIVVFAKGKQQALATEFAAFMTNKKNVATLAQFFPPARKSVLDGDAFVKANALIPPEQMAYVSAAIKDGVVLPSHVRAPQITAAMKPKMDAFWTAGAKVEAAVKGVCDAIRREL